MVIETILDLSLEVGKEFVTIARKKGTGKLIVRNLKKKKIHLINHLIPVMLMLWKIILVILVLFYLLFLVV